MTKPTAVALLIWIGGFVVLAALTPVAATSGDAALYAEQIRDSNFEERTVHLGYFWLGSSLRLFADPVTDRALHLLSSFFAASCLALLYPWILGITRSVFATLVAIASVFGHYVFALHAIHAEVYMPQAFFLLAALGLWLRQWDRTAGISLAISTLISPSTLLALPCFWLLRPSRESALRMGIVAALILVLCLAPVIDDYLFAPRGLLGAVPGFLLGKAAPGPTAASADSGADSAAESSTKASVSDTASGAASARSLLWQALLRAGFEGIFGYLALLPLLFMGVIELVTRKRFRRFALALAVFASISFLVGITHPTVPIQLPTYLFLAAVVGLGVDRFVDSIAPRSAAEPSSAWRSGKRLFELAAIAALPIAVLGRVAPMAGPFSQLPPMLPWFLFAGLGAIALIGLMLVLFGRARLAAHSLLVAMLLVNVVWAQAFVTHENQQAESYRATALRASELMGDGDLVVGTWGRGILFNHYLYGDGYGGSWVLLDELRGQRGSAARRASEAHWRSTLERGEAIWLLGSYPDLVAELADHGYIVLPFYRVHRAETTRDTPPEGREIR